jgi:hypothetical protein
LVAGSVMVFVDSRISASPEPSRDELQSRISENKVRVGSESINGYQQVYYIYDNVQVFITDGKRNHTGALISGQNVVWVETIEGFPQIVVYDLLEKTRTQVTQTGTNLSPALFGNKVVWEGLFDGVGQIFYFDGIDFKQLSSGNLSLRPSIKDSQVIYTQHMGNNMWRVLSQDATTNAPPTVVKEGTEQDSWPHFDGETIKTNLRD